MVRATGLRHPLCPYCEYDLVATVEAGHRICPECGEPFELGELIRMPQPGDWTQMVGLRRLFVAVLTRGVIACCIWMGWLAIINWLDQLPMIFGIIGFFIHLLMGAVLGMVFWTGLRDRCGFDGMFPAMVAGVGAIAAMAIGAAVIGLLLPFGRERLIWAVISAGIVVFIYILSKAILDD